MMSSVHTNVVERLYNAGDRHAVQTAGDSDLIEAYSRIPTTLTQINRLPSILSTRLVSERVITIPVFSRDDTIISSPGARRCGSAQGAALAVTASVLPGPTRGIVRSRLLSRATMRNIRQYLFLGVHI
jgi:hypothetical protein